MKKKLSINTLAMGNLRNRRKQYTVMILGIILAMIFSSTMVFFISSFYETSEEQIRNQMGDATCIVYTGHSDFDTFEDAKAQGLISTYGAAHILGYSYHKDENLGTCIGWLDEEAMKLAYHKLEEGSLPQAEGEIALEKTALLRLGYGNAKVGDTIKVTTKIQNGNDYYKNAKETYKLTGILKDKKKRLQSYMGGGSAYDNMLVAGIVAPETKIKPGGKEKIVVYAKANDNYGLKLYNDLWDHFMMNENSSTSEMLTLDYASSSLDILLRNDEFYKSLPVLLLTLVLIITSCVTIVNAWATNLKERRKQIGLLRAVGATKKQIITIFGREAIIISLVAMPISILASYGVVRLLLPMLMEDPIFTSGLKVLPACAIINLLVTMLSALAPLRSAAKITPIQGIRDINNMRVMMLKKVKSAKHFNMPRHLAKRNLMFYKAGKLAVTVVLASSIIITCYGFSVLRYSDSINYESRFDYTLETNQVDYNDVNWKTHNIGFDHEDVVALRDLPNMTEPIGIASMRAQITIDDYTDYHAIIGENNGTGKYYLMENADMCSSVEEMRDAMHNLTVDEYYTRAQEKLQRTDDFYTTSLYGFDESGLAILESCLLEGSIDAGRLTKGEEVLLAASPRMNFGTYHFEGESGNTYSFYPDSDERMKRMETLLSADCPYHVGDQIEVSVYFYKDEDQELNNPDQYEKVTKTFTIGGILDPAKLANQADLHFEEGCMITTYSGAKLIYPELKYFNLVVNSEVDIDDATDLELTQYMGDIAGQYNGTVRSACSIIREDKESDRIMFLILLCLIIMAIVICASIINNSLTASIRENKRMLGTLRAVGASRRDLTAIYVNQLNNMFLWGTSLGCAITAVIFVSSYLNAKNHIYAVMGLIFDPWATLIMLVLLYGICAWNLWRTIGKEMKHSIVDNIREL